MESKYPEDAYRIWISQQGKTLKLKLLFVAMDLFTLLAYLIVFVHSKLRRFSKSKARIPVPSLFVIVPATPGKRPIGTYEHKKGIYAY